MAEAKDESWRNDLPQEWADMLDYVLFSRQQLEGKCLELGASITKDYKGQPLLCVGILKGASMFMMDLIKTIKTPYQIDFVAVSSYGSSTTSSGSVKLKKDLDIDPQGKHVLIIEDLIDTGGTLAWLQNYFASKGCLSVEICCMLSKTARRSAEVGVKYVGFDCPDEFVVGYGMDYAEDFRGVPLVGVMKPSVYQ